MIIHISVIVLIAAIYVALSEQSQWFTSLKFYLENIRTFHDQSVHTAIGAPQKDWNLLYHLGGNGPWLPKLDGVVEGGYSPPENCRVDQVHVVGFGAVFFRLLSGDVLNVARYR